MCSFYGYKILGWDAAFREHRELTVKLRQCAKLSLCAHSSSIAKANLSSKNSFGAGSIFGDAARSSPDIRASDGVPHREARDRFPGG